MRSQIEIKNLEIGIVDKEITPLVHNISFSISKGETLGIVGESGSGKTLSAMSIIGLLPPKIEPVSGEINLISESGHSVNLMDIDEKVYRDIRGKTISVIFQEPLSSLNPSLKCGKQVEEIISTHQKIGSEGLKNMVLDLFVEVDLPEPNKAYNSYPFQLSGGQQQRVMIAMAIANKPDFIIADEPTTALDVLVQKKIMHLLKNLQIKYGMGIIFISHDIDLVAEICDNIMVMKNGKIIEKGTRNQIILNAKESYTRNLINCKPRPDTPKAKLKTIDSFDNNEEAVDSKENIKIGATILEIKNVNIFYDGQKNFLGKPKKVFQALKNISFTVHQGETLGLVGGSGSGKSTLGRAIIGLFDRIEGEMTYKGLNLSTLKNAKRNKIRKKIQLIFQDPYSSLNPKIKIGEALKEVIIVHKLAGSRKEAKQKAIQLLNDVKLPSNFYDRYPHELSGGQRQRIVIARTMAMEPEFIICDESVSALDVSVQAEVLNLLNHLKQKHNLTYIFISHDLSVVKYMSDRIIVLNQGKIEEIRKPDELFSSPESDYSRQLLEAMVTIQG